MGNVCGTGGATDRAMTHSPVITVCAKSLQWCLTLKPHGPTRLLCPWDSPGKNTGVGCCFLLQGLFPTQGSNPASLMSPALAGGLFTTTPQKETPEPRDVKSPRWKDRLHAAESCFRRILPEALFQQEPASLSSLLRDQLPEASCAATPPPRTSLRRLLCILR